MLVLPLVLTIIVWYLVICLKWKKKIFDLLEKMPGSRWYPFVGTFKVFSLASRADVIYKFIDVSKKYAPFYRSWNGNIPQVHLMKPEHIQILLRSSTHAAKGPFYQYMLPWLGQGVFIAEGAKWFLQRKLLTPAFHFKILEGFLEIFAEKAQILTETLATKADGSYFSVLPYLHVNTLGAILETSIGVPLDKVTDRPLDYVKNVHEITEIYMWRFWRPLVSNFIFKLLPIGRRHNKLVDELHAFSKKVVACKKELSQAHPTLKFDSESGKRKRLTFMDLILDATENQKVLSDSDMQALVDTFIFAGFETTGNTIGWALFLLGNHPEIQDKAYEEIKRVLKDKKAATTMAELNELKYIDYIVKETLRLYPVLPFLTRTTSEDIEIDGYKVPAGTQAIAHIYDVQRDPHQYVEPDKFMPERFMPENAKLRHPFCFIPFSAGPRNCLGMRFALLELRSIIAAIIKKYKITSLHKIEDMKIFAHLLIRPQAGIHIKLERREEFS